LFVALKCFSSTRAGRPPVEFDAAIGTLNGRRQRAQVAGRRRACRVGRLLLGLRPGIKQLLLERVQLLHKVEVWVDVRLALQHHIVRLVERQLPVSHQVRQHHRYRARYARQTVHQDAFLLRPTLIYNRNHCCYYIKVQKKYTIYYCFIIFQMEKKSRLGTEEVQERTILKIISKLRLIPLFANSLQLTKLNIKIFINVSIKNLDVQ